MNFVLLWQLLTIILGAGARMESLQTGDTAHTTDAGIPPAFVTWRDGRRFEVSLHITRTK